MCSARVVLIAIDDNDILEFVFREERVQCSISYETTIVQCSQTAWRGRPVSARRRSPETASEFTLISSLTMTSSLLINGGETQLESADARDDTQTSIRARSNLERSPRDRRDLDVNSRLSRNCSSSSDECTNEHRRDRFQRSSRGVWKPRRNLRHSMVVNPYSAFRRCP